MSNHWIRIVPLLPQLIPSSINAENGARTLEQLVLGGESIEIVRKENVHFFDSGENFEKISCPKCQTDVNIDWWKEIMSKDFSENSGFQLNQYVLPCCSSPVSLNALNYLSHQAFGRFSIDAVNPRVAELSGEAIRRIEAALGCKVSVVYRRL